VKNPRNLRDGRKEWILYRKPDKYLLTIFVRRYPVEFETTFIKKEYIQLAKTILFILMLAIFSQHSIILAEDKIRSDLNEEIVQIPMITENFWGKNQIQLTATVYRPQGSGPFPLIVLSHGSTKSDLKRSDIGRYRKIPQIQEFIKRGFAVIVPIRRGYGMTGGDFAENFDSCSNPTYYEAGKEAAKDLIATINFGAKLPYIKPDTIVLVGHSGGGFASLATASMNPPGVVGVINFAGGRGGQPETHPGEPCYPERLKDAIKKFAKTTTIPVLWVYSENDQFFNPKHVHDFFQVYKDTGAQGRLILEPPFGKDGHMLFPSKEGISIWISEFDRFLTEDLRLKIHLSQEAY
jgi:dienelactone hydrolase